MGVLIRHHSFPLVPYLSPSTISPGHSAPHYRADVNGKSTQPFYIDPGLANHSTCPNAHGISSHGYHQHPRERLEDRRDPGSRHSRLPDSIPTINEVLSEQSVPTRSKKLNS